MNAASYDHIARRLADPDSPLHRLTSRPAWRRKLWALRTYWVPRILWSAAVLPLFPFWYLAEVIHDRIVGAGDGIDGYRAVEEFIAERERRRRTYMLRITMVYAGPRVVVAPPMSDLEIEHFKDRWLKLIGPTNTEDAG